MKNSMSIEELEILLESKRNEEKAKKLKNKHNINDIETKLAKTFSFLDIMVRAVFISTFVFTIIMIVFAWQKEWEQALIVLIEKWFTIMVGELVVTGFIQIVKEVVEGWIRWTEAKLQNSLESNDGNDIEDIDNTNY